MVKVVKKIIFYEELNNVDYYPMSNLKIDKILHDKNYIGTYSKDNVPILKNYQSTIINLQDSDKNGSHWVSYKKLVIKYFILIHMLYHLYHIL